MRWRSSWASGMASLWSRLTTRSLGTLTALSILYSIRAARLRSSSTFSPSVSPPPSLPCSPACCRVLNVVAWVGVVMYLPAWMPGAGFKRLARSVRGSIRDMEYIPLRRVQQAMVRLPLPSSSFINTDGGVIRRVRVRGVGACGFGCCMCCGHGVCDVVYYGGWTDRLRARGSPRWRARSSRRRCARRAGS